MAEESIATATLSKTERRKNAKLVKKNKKLLLKRAREEKRQGIIENIRAKRKDKDHTSFDKNSCWKCGSKDHRRQDCKEDCNISVVCFHCRRRGHTIQQCEIAKKRSVIDIGVCYNCGESGHSLSGCLKPVTNGGLSFATCFLCKEKGHLSSACAKSVHGIYPKGGECKCCGSKMHLARDCPDSKRDAKRLKTSDENDTPSDSKYGRIEINESGDSLDDVPHQKTDLSTINKDTTRVSEPIRPKVVKF